MENFRVVTTDGKRHIIQAIDGSSVTAIMATAEYNYKPEEIAAVYPLTEPVFTLRAQDKSAAKTVCYWIMENIETAPEDKLKEALTKALKMRDFDNRKAAD